MSRQLTKAQLAEQLEAALVRCQALETQVLSLRSLATVQVPPQQPARIHQHEYPRTERRYTKADGRVFEVVADLCGGRIVKTHKFVGMAWEVQ